VTLTEEESNDNRPLHEDAFGALGGQLDARYIADTVSDTIGAVSRQLSENMQAIQRLIPYLSGLYYADSQRRYAERELFRLQSERVTLEARIQNALVIVPELLYPVGVKTGI